MNSNTLAAVPQAEGCQKGLPVAGQPDRQPSRPSAGLSGGRSRRYADVAAGAFPIAFSNFPTAIITERMATRITARSYSNKPFVNFYATKRVGGQLLGNDARSSC